jgi:hypothetical protein
MKSISNLPKTDSVTGMTITNTSPSATCESCIIAKGKKGSSPKESLSRAVKPYQIVWFDVVIVSSPVGFRGETCTLVFLDDYSLEVTAYCLSSRQQVPSKLEQLDKEVYNQRGYHIHFLRCDNAKEHKSNILTSYCRSHGIIQQYTIPYHSNQNKEERFNLTLFNGVRAMLHSSKLSKSYWPLAVSCFVYTYNRGPTAANGTVTPLEKSRNLKPDVSHLKTFGQLAYAFIPKTKRSIGGGEKLKDRKAKYRFVGYCPNQKGYLLLDSSGTLSEAAFEDVEFPISTFTVTHEPISTPNPYASLDISLDISEITTPTNPTTDDAFPENDTCESIPYSSDDAESHTEVSDTTQEPLSSLSIPPVIPNSYKSIGDNLYRHPTKGIVSDQLVTEPARKDILSGPTTSRKSRSSPVDYSNMFRTLDDSIGNYSRNSCTPFDPIVAFSSDDFLTCFDSINFHWEYGSLNRITTGDAPLRYSEIMNRSDRLLWTAATDAEMAQLAANNTFELVPPPPGSNNIMRSKWVFKVKRDPDGNITKHKARLVACGYTQKKGIDYDETYSPVARADSLRFFLSICAALGIQPHKMDVTGAFLYGIPNEQLFMHQPDGYTDTKHPTWVWKLLKSLYGLKQAPRIWHNTIDPHLQSLGFDPCIYVRWNTDRNFSLIFLHVDDLLIHPGIGDCLATIKQSLTDKFAMTDDGPADHVLGFVWIRQNDEKKCHFFHTTFSRIFDHNRSTNHHIRQHNTM